VLPASHRMRRSAEFARTIREGIRSAGRYLVVHAARIADPTPAEPARVGFVVSKAVGGAVERNKVQRRLRAAIDPTCLDEGFLLVVRARPAAARASFTELQQELERLYGRVRGRVAEEGVRR